MQHPIASVKKESLPPCHPLYDFESFIQQAVLDHLLDDAQISSIQSQLLTLLAQQIDKWNKGESSSIPVEKAQEILTSILFTLSLQIKTYPSMELVIQALQTQPLLILFEAGLQIIKQKELHAKALHHRIIKNLFKTPNIYYHSTIVDGISGFFHFYRPQFASHEILITADYPVFLGAPQADGIEFIEQYLHCIEAENAFLAQFDATDVHHLLSGLTTEYHLIPLNLFEYVMFSACGLILRKKQPQNLNLSKKDIAHLYQRFSNQSTLTITMTLKQALGTLLQAHLLPRATKQYMQLTLPLFVSAIQQALETKTLNKLFLVPLHPKPKIQISLNYQQQMDQIAYQKLLEKLLKTTQSQQKVNLLLQQVHSLADLLDLLEDGQFSIQDDILLVHSLPLPVFVFLLSRYPDDSFLNRESEQFLFQALSQRRQQLSTKQQQVNQLLATIQTDDPL